MSSFVALLTRELHAWQDETCWLGEADIRQMLERAAAGCVEQLAAVRLYREIEPVELTPLVVVQAGEDYILLPPEDVATLRALLLAFDEDAPPRPGEPLTVPCRLEDGRVVSIVTGEMLNG